MKKLLLLAIIFCLTACAPETSMVEDYRNKEDVPVKHIRHFKYKGHDYILFKTYGINSAVGGVVHDPDCKCKAK